VRAAGDQVYPEAGNGAGGQGFIAGGDGPGAGAVLVENLDDTAGGVLEEKGAAGGGGGLRDAADEANVIFFDGALFEGFEKDGMGAGVFGEETQAAGFVVETVDGGEEPMTASGFERPGNCPVDSFQRRTGGSPGGYFIGGAGIAGGGRFEGVGGGGESGTGLGMEAAEICQGEGAGFVGFHADAGGFVHQEDVFILVNDAEDGRFLMGGGQKNRESLTGMHRGVPIRADAVQLYIPGGEDFSEDALGQGRQKPTQKQAGFHAFGIGRDNGFSDRHRSVSSEVLR
jgi:hypothetical protein